MNRTRLKEMLKYAVTVNGQPVTRHDHPLRAGDTLEIRRRPAPIRAETPFPVLYEDDEIIVLDKPSGILTVASEAEKIFTVHRLLNESLLTKSARTRIRSRAFIVHRLDKETSGVLIFAKNETAKRALQHGWDRAEKTYWAVVYGVPKDREGKIESWLRENTIHKVYSGPRSGQAKLAVTRYRVVKTKGPYSLMEIHPETGRKNQIRVHMADLGCPIVGDDKYGKGKGSVRRLALHAGTLKIKHPKTSEEMTFESPLPESLKKLTG